MGAGTTIRLCAAVGLAIAFVSPLVSQIGPSLAPSVLRNYLVPSYSGFTFFPWGAYLAFGMSAGSLIRVIPPEATGHAMKWIAAGSGVTVVACQFFAALSHSLYAKSDFWLNSPAQVLTKQAVTLLMLAFAFLWTRYGATAGAWSMVRQFGTTSLLVYWVHIELVYGRWLWFWKNNLTVPQTMVAAVGVILLMLAISVIRTNWQTVSAALSDAGWWYSPKPDRVPGD